jgi:SPP1 gp7 family putative phage head morphogenesis protein
MKQIKLKPVQPSKRIEDKLKKEILTLLQEEFFRPIMLAVGVNKIKVANSMDDLLSAIKSGQIVYWRGKFSGKYSATLTRELRRLGAKWDGKQGQWTIPLQNLPVEVKNEIYSYRTKTEEKREKLLKSLSRIDPENIAEKLNVNSIFDAMIHKAESDFKKATANLTVTPELNRRQLEFLRQEYKENLKLSIKDFTTGQILKLREDVSNLTYAGFRYEDMIDDIQKRYGVTVEKATFLARQENNLAVAKYRQTRFQDAGVDKYEWRAVHGSPAHPTRPAHKALSGKIFQWDKPPVTTEPGQPQRRNNPGEDYNCRCIAIPVVEF